MGLRMCDQRRPVAPLISVSYIWGLSMIMTSLWEGTSAFIFFTSQSAQYTLENRKEWLFPLVQMPLRVLQVIGRLDLSVVIWGKVSVVLWEE